ncbi:MAG: hypothetical protein BMS9Abin01_1640 [Gammaproteobacteria bacterium]|nr:MAG: hypothetical protein BMS9Abin01_1640 [Gammaproteobacteria bacterium]
MAIVAPDARRRHITAWRLSVAGALLFFALVVVGALYLAAQHGFSPESLEQTIQSWGMWGVAASVGLMVLHSFVPFPAEFLAIANGMVYGPLWGIVITWTGAMLGGYAAFGVARVLGRPFVESLVVRRNWHTLDDWATARGGFLVLVSRLIPVIAFNLVNYAAGLSRISWWTFTWATGIGILPMVAAMVLIGDYMEVLTWEMWLLLGVFMLVLAYACRRYSRGIRERNARHGADPHAE